MKRFCRLVLYLTIFMMLAFSGPLYGETQNFPLAITADEAFDAYQDQKDPITGLDSRVALVDIRSRAEFFWVGTASEVNKIILKNNEILIPEKGKVRLIRRGGYVRFNARNVPWNLNVENIKTLELSPISISIPLLVWDEKSIGLVPNGKEFIHFTEAMNALSQNYDTLIIYCKSGGRSSAAVKYFNPQLFKTIYEIDQQDKASGFGGFEGSGYGSTYNGYTGFPQRKTEFQDHVSVSWKDAGLPVKIGSKPTVSLPIIEE